MKIRVNGGLALFLALVGLLSAAAAGSQVEIPGRADLSSVNELGCVVGGHGPYPSDRAACEKLGREQARTNCILAADSGEEVSVKISFRAKSAVTLAGSRLERNRSFDSIEGECHAKPNADHQDCGPSHCRWFSTPLGKQHP